MMLKQSMKNDDIFSWFAFYKNLYDLKQNEVIFKQNYKHTIVHPYLYYDEQTPIEYMEGVTVTLEMCTLF